MHSILGPPSIPAAPRRISGVSAGAATIAVAVLLQLLVPRWWCTIVVVVIIKVV